MQVLVNLPTAHASEIKRSLRFCWSEDSGYEFSLPVKTHAGAESCGLFVHLAVHCYWIKPGASTSALAPAASLAPWLPPLCSVCTATPGATLCTGTG